MKKFRNIIIVLMLLSAMAFSASAVKHTVVKDDTMWKLSRAYGVTLQSVIDANPHIEDPNLIYP
ncbi:MAG: LysM peptidoglycan-binding domain-containing protein, partial [Clostridia bacterium]|nr:LysM peptidoglycan-binding domain-containing protein [Clostridia bacterium]